MSTVAVVQKGGIIAIAADTCTKLGNLKLLGRYKANSDASKIMRFGDTYVATVGATVHNDVLASIFRKYPEKISFNSRADIFETYLAIHPILKEEYFINASADKDDDYESSQIDALVANPHGIFGMYTWRTVVEYERFFAIGSGREFALGAMHAVYDTLTAPEIARAGIAAGCEFDDSSELPMTLYTIEARPKTGEALSASAGQ